MTTPDIATAGVHHVGVRTADAGTRQVRHEECETTERQLLSLEPPPGEVPR